MAQKVYGKNVSKVVGKGSKCEYLPNRMARAQLTGGDMVQRSMNNYAKSTPGVGNESPDIFGMGKAAGKIG